MAEAAVLTILIPAHAALILRCEVDETRVIYSASGEFYAASGCIFAEEKYFLGRKRRQNVVGSGEVNAVFYEQKGVSL